MKKIYESPALDVIEIEVGSLLQEASLPLKDENASGDGMSRELGIFFDNEK